MQFKKSSIVWLLLLNFAAEITSSASVTTTDVGGLPVTKDVILGHPEKRADPAADTTTSKPTSTPGVAATTPATSKPTTSTTPGVAATTPATSKPTTSTTPGVAATTPATSKPTTSTTPGVAATTPATSKPTTSTTPGVAATTPATSKPTTSTTPAAATTPATSTSATETSKSGSSTITDSSSDSTSSKNTDRPDPSTNKFTPPPSLSSAVTTLSLDTLATMTEVKDGKTSVYTTTKPGTSGMWVTYTVTAGGSLSQLVVQTTFAQKFTSMYSKEASPKKGSIGLGTISGHIGVVKSSNKYTLSSSGVAPQFSCDRSMFFSLAALLMWFL